MKPAPTAKTQSHELSTPEVWDDDPEMLEEYDFSNARPNPYFARYAANPKHYKPGIRFVTDNVGRKVGVLLDLSQYQAVWDEHSKDLDLNEFQFLGTRSEECREVLLEFDQHLELWQAIFDSIVHPYQP